MTKRKKRPTVVHEHLAIEIENFKARIDSSLNYDVREPRYRYDEARVYEFLTAIDIEGICVWPEERADEIYRITIYGSEKHTGEFERILKDFHVRDEYGSRVYRKVRGKHVPVYDIPNGIGFLERQRGTKDWSGCVWVLPRVTLDMLALLPNLSPLYLAIHECKKGRHRRILGLALQTTNPADE